VLTVKAVFFDLDDTLYDRESLVRQVVHELHAAFGTHLAGVSEVAFVHKLLTLDNHGYSDKAALFQTVASEWRLGADIGEAMLQRFLAMLAGNCRLPEDARMTLCTLREHGKKLGVITNGGTVTQQAKIESLGLPPLVDAILISEAEGVRKPDPAIFLRACRRVGVDPGESVFVGDNPEADIAGAQNAGLKPVLMQVSYRSVALPDVIAVDKLSDILPLCIGR
jgi:putative hydrolase of the HAD superfamily